VYDDIDTAEKIMRFLEKLDPILPRSDIALDEIGIPNKINPFASVWVNSPEYRVPSASLGNLLSSLLVHVSEDNFGSIL
jgi:hypothetical protein